MIVARAEIVSSFLKWMVTSGYIPRYKREMELGANYLLERGLTYYLRWLALRGPSVSTEAYPSANC